MICGGVHSAMAVAMDGKIEHCQKKEKRVIQNVVQAQVQRSATRGIADG